MYYGGAAVDFIHGLAISIWVFVGFTSPGSCAGAPVSCGFTLTGPTTVSATYVQQPLPTTTTNAATGVTANSATLNGCINGSSVVTGKTFSVQVYFEYGTSPTLSGASTTSQTSQPLDGTNHCPTAPLLGLTTKTTYYYRIVSVFNPISPSTTTTRGSILSFTTN
jgi:hypothetical protein